MGLLGESFDDPKTQGLLTIGLSLLGSNGPFSRALAQAGQQGLLSYQGAEDRRDARSARSLSAELAQLQLEQARQAQAQQQQVLQAAQRRAMSPGAAAVNANGGPTTAAAAALPRAPGGFDWQGFASDVAGINPTLSLQIASSMRKDAPKVKDTQVMVDPRTQQPVQVVVFDDGTTRVLPFGAKPDVALQSLGDRVVAIDRNRAPTGASWAMGASPDARLSSGTQLQVAGMTDRRERDLAGTAVTYVDMPDGSKAALPSRLAAGSPALVQPRTVAGSNKNATAAAGVNDVIDRAVNLVPDATGSYSGKLFDMLAQVFGAATPGAVKAGQLKVLEGKLMLAQPRMEGPQSDKDVALYRQMAAMVGDDTVPPSVKLGALETLRSLQDKYTQPGIPGAPVRPPAAAPQLGSVLRFDAQGNLLPPGM